MDHGSCIVCAERTTPDREWSNDDIDLCEQCKFKVLDTFRRALNMVDPKYRDQFLLHFFGGPHSNQ
jgi:hypothetical protein